MNICYNCCVWCCKSNDYRIYFMNIIEFFALRCECLSLTYVICINQAGGKWRMELIETQSFLPI